MHIYIYIYVHRNLRDEMQTINDMQLEAKIPYKTPNITKPPKSGRQLSFAREGLSLCPVIYGWLLLLVAHHHWLFLVCRLGCFLPGLFFFSIVLCHLHCWDTVSHANFVEA